MQPQGAEPWASAPWGQEGIPPPMIPTSIGILQVGSPWLSRQWINSIPGMSAGSIVPKQARAMGMSLGEMFDLIIADTCRK